MKRRRIALKVALIVALILLLLVLAKTEVDFVYTGF